ANVTIPEIQVGRAQLSWGGASARPTRVFAYAYRDRREISVRPDNTRRVSDSVDVTIWTLGAAHVATTNVTSGELDTVVWGAAQGGAWYELTHRAWSAAAEAGHRWPRTPGRPWFRIGVLAAS